MTETTLRDQLQSSLGTAYTIQRELGGGGMSHVFVARDEALGRDIVIKVLPRELAAEMSAERFAREIKLAAALQHPHVLPVLSAGVADRLPYYTMPFVRGESLRVAMNNKSLSTDDALAVLRDIARALRYAHGEGVVHRDIKPENILLSSGSAVVVDFGIAKALSASRTEAPGGTLTLVGTSMGTPQYMSPEQAAADPNIDHRADLYAWGVVAYELLAGRHPFEGKITPQQFLAAHLSEAPPPLRKLAPGVPGTVADVIMRTLEKDPNRRPQSADEILTQLGGTSSTSAGAISIERRSSLTLPLIAVAAVILLAIGAWMWKGRAAPAADTPIMLAVLPFENQGPSEHDYFVDGLTDAVNGKLAGLSGIGVIDRRSTLPYKKTSKPVKQIGTELGVEYVLGGVVRWAKGPSGMRAQVSPTLVSTRDATTKWAGDPVVVSSDDPFSAQTEIATKVAGALQLALGTQEKRELAKRPTQNTEAYDAYLRGRSLIDRSMKASFSLRDIDQAIAELRRAVSLDPVFARAWATLSNAYANRLYEVPGDTTSARVVHDAAARAMALDRTDPFVILVQSGVMWREGNRSGSKRMVEDALKAGIVDPDLLAAHAWDLSDAGQLDSSEITMDRAIKLNPRYADTRLSAADLAEQRRDWAGATKHVRALISLDPTDERGWAELAQIPRFRGDTAGIRRSLEEALRYIPAPSNLLLVFMVYAGHDFGTKFVRMTPEQLRIETLRDSVGTYYDNKADFFLREGDLPRARIYHDSIIRKLENRSVAGPAESRLRLYLANAYGATGQTAAARRELDRSMAAARTWKQFDPDGSPSLDHRMVAAVYGYAGQYEEAVRQLRAFAKTSSWTPAGLALEPKLQVLRGNPLFEAFVKGN
ncbi:MAG TPA: protein kinase [Gemmatimonadaceae bacterium]|nr:protein kinase [Gemmatimonadaceae bacterium]